MRIEDFQKNEAYVSQLRSLKASSLWGAIQAVFQAEHPCRVDNPTWNQEQRASHQARTAGYEKALNVLDALAQDWQKPKPILRTQYAQEKNKE